MVSGIDDPDVAGAQTLKGDLLSIAITDATLFIGSGARLNIDSTKPEFGTVTLPASNDPTAIGFSVSGGSLDLGVFTASAMAADGTTYETTANFVLYELAVQSTHELRVWPGRVRHTLRRVDGELRMAAKVVELVTASQPQPNLAFLL